MNRLLELWQNSGYPGIERLNDIAKKKGIVVTKKQISDFVKSQDAHQLHAKAPKPAVSHPITTSSPRIEFQMDLLDMSKYARSNSGNNWILIVEDIFDRKAFAAAIKTKSPVDVLPAIKAAIDKLGKPLAIVSDDGKEWLAGVGRWLQEHNIARRTAEIGDHRVLGVIDALSKFVKNALHKHFTHTQSTNYTNYLIALIDSYNNTPHSSLEKMTPNEAQADETTTRDIHYARVINTEWQPKFKVGDRVRLLKRKQTFNKGYEVRFSIEVYTIAKVDGINYVLSNGKKVREFMIQAAGEEKRVERALAADDKKDVILHAKQNHRVDQILQHKEGVSQDNRRAGLRERKPSSLVSDDRYGKIKW